MRGKKQEKRKTGEKETIADIFGENVFSIKTMRNYLSDSAYKSLTSTICQGKTLDPKIADEVADAMKSWALEKGASHFTHWFQPLTGATAEKHDSFLVPDSEGGAICQFSGAELIKGEPDASSFPSGGLRATFEARGYTAWDPTSPAFLKQCKDGATLCIPTVFWSYHGESLDKKTPLLRSAKALAEQICRLARLFGIDCGNTRAFVSLGPEQEYFLIDKKFYETRLDLLQTGRTLFGRKPPKHQQLEDHYFGVIKSRVLAFMYELDRELWRFGIPAKTRHNEVCPGQFEIAPIFEELNLAVDHNMLTMEVLRDVADRHGFACLLHEKPFAGVNGSGKHNNWSVHGPDGKNWVTPGSNPRDNAKFLTVICALMKAVDTHAALLRSTVASAGNDRRLGANEAPPAIMSIFLGQQLSGVIEQLGRGDSRHEPNPAEARSKTGSGSAPETFGKGSGLHPRGGRTIEIGVSSLPSLPRDATDRNRTSPFAFTGNKFEFRAVGSSQSCAGANIVLNTIVAQALDEICNQLEADIAAGKGFYDSLQTILKNIVTRHKRILFDGDSYTDDWRNEAEKRGLPNLKNTPDALKALTDTGTVALFEKYGVLTNKELRSRYEIYQHTYDQVVAIEANCALAIARTMIAPAALTYQGELAETIRRVEAVGQSEMSDARKLLTEVRSETDKTLSRIKKLEACIEDGSSGKMIQEMEALRNAVDNLEGLLPDDLWPLPSYTEMMFII